MKRSQWTTESLNNLGSGTSVWFHLTFLWCLTDLVIETARSLRRLPRGKREEDRLRREGQQKRPTSFNPPPESSAVSAQWRRAKTSLQETLRFGSMLLDLESVVDSSPVVRYNRAGTRKVIVARNPGIKGWLREHCPEIVYSTAMRYKQLAAQARTASGLSREVPLEWAFADQAPRDAERPARVRSDVSKARAKLEHWGIGKSSRLGFSRVLDAELGRTHRPLRRSRRTPSSEARRRMSQRWLSGVFRDVNRRLATLPNGLASELRDRLVRELRGCEEGLGRSSASTGGRVREASLPPGENLRSSRRGS